MLFRSIKDANWSYVKREFKKLKKAAKNKVLRINIESPLLTAQEITKICNVAAECGITSLRSASGAFGCGFDADTLTLMQNAVKDKCIVKADGVNNIIDMNTAVDMGAGIVGSRNASDLARLILQTADY